MSIILGIDPGVEGALAFIDTEACTLRVFDMPTFSRTTTKTKRFTDAVSVGTLLRSAEITHAFVEQVAASPQMGVVSAFSFGQSFGTLKGALSALLVPLDEVPPAVWKRQMRAPKDKKESKARARELMPACAHLFRRADHAEAAMLAMFGCFSSARPLNRPLTPAE